MEFGDSLRGINWRVSAPLTGAVVSQRRPDNGADAIVLLDSFVESGHDAHTMVGLAIEVTVALAEKHLAITGRVGLIDMGGILRRVSPRTGRLWHVATELGWLPLTRRQRIPPNDGVDGTFG